MLEDKAARLNEFSSSLSDFEEFLDSYLWKDIGAEIGIWIEELRSMLEVSTDHDDICRIQGRIEALKYVLNIPEQIKEQIEADLLRDEGEFENG